MSFVLLNFKYIFFILVINIDAPPMKIPRWSISFDRFRIILSVNAYTIKEIDNMVEADTPVEKMNVSKISSKTSLLFFISFNINMANISIVDKIGRIISTIISPQIKRSQSQLQVMFQL